jgi:hypothetical protein
MSSSSKPLEHDALTWPHALPYRVLFEEHRARRGSDFTLLLEQWSRETGNAELRAGADVEGLYLANLAAVEDAYRKLDQERRELRSASSKSYQSPADRQSALDVARAKAEEAAMACHVADVPMKRLLHRCSGSALCLSGGGIRSASFSLGVLQGLAKFSLASQSGPGFLQKLDFLSTVSGGGYIGSWLMGWARRSNFEAAVKGLGRGGLTAGDPEPDPIRHLREYTSFLAPRAGFSVDRATLAAIFLRNLLLVWIIFLPCLSALILAPRLLSIWGRDFADWIHDSTTVGTVFRYVARPFPPFIGEVLERSDARLMLCATGLVLAAGWLAGKRESKQAPDSFPNSPKFSLRIEQVFIVVTIVAAWFIVEAWIAGWTYDREVYHGFNQTRICWLLCELCGASIFMSIARVRRRVPAGRDPFRNSKGKRLLVRTVWSFAAVILAGAFVAVLFEVFAFKVGPTLYANAPPAFNILALPIVMALLMMGSALLSGLLSGIEYEEEREWWARAGGAFLIFLLVWIVAQTLSWHAQIFVGLGIGDLVSAKIWGLGAALFGGLAAKAGNSAASSGSARQVDLSQLSKWGQFLARHGLLAPTISLVAICCIFLLVGRLNDVLLSWISAQCLVFPLSGHLVGLDQAAAILFVGAVVMAVLANFFINVNTFSLHGMYRMRLVRAFLGASNLWRNPDAFTDFDEEDNLPLSRSKERERQDGPMHVIGVALNLVQSRNLAWQQRKAESFTLTPLRCGSWRIGYEHTAAYGGLHGITLGTAMAISGAAFNPNMGYNSSPLVTFVMTLFNARLGWWLPNPQWPHHHRLSESRKMRFLSKNGPTFGLASIVSEALGRTDDRQRWIQLSDGGHFDNLELYEMVLRRCRFIVVVDASADRQFNFEDLGNAIRKINVDLGIPVTFPGVWPFSNKSAVTDRYCAVGEIDYGCVDEGAPTGHILYLKPQLIGKEPRDVSAYAASNEAFPHQSTANQFFNEAQFESYRHLGSHAIQEITAGAATYDISGLFDAARQHCN